MAEKQQLIDRMARKMANSGVSETALNALEDSGITEAQLTELATLGVYGLVKLKKISGLTGLATAAETDTGWDVPDKAMILDCFIDVTTAVSAKTIDIGTDGSGSNDPDGFADALSVAATGRVRPGVAIDGGGNFYNTNTKGALLSSFVQGTDADDRGLYNEFPDVSSSGEDVTYTPETGTAALVFDLYILYLEFE